MHEGKRISKRKSAHISEMSGSVGPSTYPACLPAGGSGYQLFVPEKEKIETPEKRVDNEWERFNFN